MKVLQRSISFLTLGTLLVLPLFPVSAASTFQYIPSKTQAQSSWYSADWKYRIKITVDHEQVGEDVTDFPMLVKITNNQKLFKNAKQDGHDLLFTSSDGITKLDHEIEQYDADNQQLNAWVKVPKLLVTEDTVLYAYYGNPTSEDQQKPTNVWGGYMSVWHLNEDPVGQIKDVSSQQNYLASTGAMNQNDSSREGKIAQALKCDGTNDALLGSLNSPVTGDLTMSAWFKTTATHSSAGRLLDLARSSTSGGFQITMNNGATQGKIDTDNSGGTSGSFSPPMAVASNDGEWHFVTGRRTGTTYELFVDGRRIGSTGGTLQTYSYMYICDISESADRFFNGIIDQITIIPTVRTGGWIKTEYNNQSDPESFYTLSSEETRTTNTLTTPLLFTYSSLSSFKEQATKNNGTILYQLSPDNGKTWYYVKNNQWIKATKEVNASTADVINKNIKNLPFGTNQLKVKAYLKPADNQPVALEALTFTYEPGKATKGSTATPTTLSSGLVTRVNEAFNEVYTRIPTYTEWEYWAKRVLNKEKTTFDALLGAIQWQKNK